MPFSRERPVAGLVVLLDPYEDELAAVVGTALAQERHARDESQLRRRSCQTVILLPSAHGAGCPLSRVRYWIRRHADVVTARRAVVTSRLLRSYGGGMSLWEERAARNEALFREVNDRVEGLHAPTEPRGTADFICECADDSCTTRITVPLDTYERVRSNSRHFLVKPGHEKLHLEEVIESEADFLVVSKNAPDAARIAEETNPR
jgi:hypothetical protein